MMALRVAGVAMALSVALVAWLALPERVPDGDLKQELQALTQDLRGRIPPLPEVRPAPAATYRGAALPDPFYPRDRAPR